MSVAGVVAALGAEARTLGPAKKRGDGLSVRPDGLLVAVSGMGCEAAASAARALVDAGATALVSWGMAGGLDPTLRAGTVCLPVLVISRDGNGFGTDVRWRRIANAALATRCVVVHGKLLTQGSPIEHGAAKAAAFRETGAVAVDMESAAIAEVAASRGLPFLAVRAIVDTAADRLPDAVLAASRAGPLRIGKLLRGLAASPQDIPPLLRLARRYRAATRALTAAARSGALAPFKSAAARSA